MDRVFLERFESGDHGTFGRLTARGMSFFTGELPWEDNAPNVSCIPPGIYECAWTMSPRFGRSLYLVNDVPGRSGVRIHPANLMGKKPAHKCQLNGCIALGERLGWIDGQKAVLLSATAVRAFEEVMERKPFDLEVRHVG